MAVGNLQARDHVDPLKNQVAKEQTQGFEAVLTRHLHEQTKPQDGSEARALEQSLKKPVPLVRKRQDESVEEKPSSTDPTSFLLASVFASVVEEPLEVVQDASFEAGINGELAIAETTYHVDPLQTQAESQGQAVPAVPPDVDMNAQKAVTQLLDSVFTQVPVQEAPEGPQAQPGLSSDVQSQEKPSLDLESVQSLPDKQVTSRGEPMEWQRSDMTTTELATEQILPEVPEVPLGREGAWRPTLRSQRDAHGESNKTAVEPSQVRTEVVTEGSVLLQNQERTEPATMVSELDSAVASTMQAEERSGAMQVPEELMAQVSDPSPGIKESLASKETILTTREVEAPETDLELETFDSDGEILTARHQAEVKEGTELLASEQKESEEGARFVLKSTPEKRSTPEAIEPTGHHAHQPTLESSQEIPKAEVQMRELLDVQDRDNLFPKLVQTIETLVLEERSEVRMQLKPDHLGTLEVKLSMERGIMVAEFVVQNQQVREILASQLPQLQTALQDQGTHMADVSVSIGLGHKEADSQGQERSRQMPRQSYGRIDKASVPGSDKAYLGRSIWNQVDVRV